MQSLQKSSIFRIFSANDWNRLEHIIRSNQILLIISNWPILFSNAEKLRKIHIFNNRNISSEATRINWSIGFTILFPIIQKCFSFLTLAQVAL